MKGRLKDFSLFLRRWLPVAIWVALVLYSSTSVGAAEKTQGTVVPWIVKIFPFLAQFGLTDVNLWIRKTGHVLQFFVLALLLWRALRLGTTTAEGTKRAIAAILLTSLALAIGSEVIQFFSPLRGARISDVLLDFSGTISGLLFIFGIRRLRARGKNSPGKRHGSKNAGHRILFTADLDLDSATQNDGGEAVRCQLAHAVETFSPDIVVVAGDLGPGDRAGDWLEILKKSLGHRLVICLGNRDHWCEPEAGCGSPADVRRQFWLPACRTLDIPCLDFENYEMPGAVLCGGYGHYDLSMRDPDLQIDGRTPQDADYIAGHLGGVIWQDMDLIPGARECLFDEAQRQGEGLRSRLARAVATGNNVVFITHTAPFRELAFAHDLPAGPLRFFNAYSGNSHVGNLLREIPPSLAVCAHTRVASPLLVLHGIPCINIGSSPAAMRFVLHDTAGGSASHVVP